MIRFSLQCDKDHTFEGWFASNDAFDAQVKRRLVNCPFCGSTKVEKALMAPNVVTARRKSVQIEATADVIEAPAIPSGSAVPAPNAQTSIAQTSTAQTSMAQTSIAQALMAQAPMILAPEQTEILAKLQELSRKVRANTENVGKEFAEEARKIHFGEVAPRAIYGEATNDDVQSLIEDGVAIAPLAPLPEDRN